LLWTNWCNGKLDIITLPPLWFRCKNMGHGPNLPKGQSTGRCFCHFHESVNDIRLILINITSCDVNPPIFWHVWQNLNIKLIGSYKIFFFQNSHSWVLDNHRWENYTYKNNQNIDLSLLVLLVNTSLMPTSFSLHQ
jgi:hypothetical protein